MCHQTGHKTTTLLGWSHWFTGIIMTSLPCDACKPWGKSTLDKWKVEWMKDSSEVLPVALHSSWEEDPPSVPSWCIQVLVHLKESFWYAPCCFFSHWLPYQMSQSATGQLKPSSMQQDFLPGFPLSMRAISQHDRPDNDKRQILPRFLVKVQTTNSRRLKPAADSLCYQSTVPPLEHLCCQTAAVGRCVCDVGARREQRGCCYWITHCPIFCQPVCV